MPVALRSDPALGVFETMLVAAGRPVALRPHLARLAASLEALYGLALPEDAEELLREHTAGIELGRVRLTVAPGPGGAVTTVAAEPISRELFFPAPPAGPELRGVVVPGGLGDHKWADRSLLPAPSAGVLPLLLEPDGEILEADRANVFIARDGALSTPAADGRILPGVTRATVIELARREGIAVSERRVSVADLLSADEVLMTGSVRGIEVARSLDGEGLHCRGDLANRLGAALRERWWNRHRAAEPLGPAAR